MIEIEKASECLDENVKSFSGLKSSGRRFFEDIEVKLRKIAGGREVLGEDEYMLFKMPKKCEECNKSKVQSCLMIGNKITKEVERFFDIYPEAKNMDGLVAISACNRCDTGYLVFGIE